MKQKLSTKLERVRKHLDAIAAVTVAIGTLGGAIVAAGDWIISEVSAQSNQRIDQLQDEINDHQKAQQLVATRVELMLLMEHDPTNKVEIERLARHYFVDLGGNAWMSSRYSRWCAEYGGDISVVVAK